MSNPSSIHTYICAVAETARSLSDALFGRSLGDLFRIPSKLKAKQHHGRVLVKTGTEKHMLSNQCINNLLYRVLISWGHKVVTIFCHWSLWPQLAPYPRDQTLPAQPALCE